MARNTSPHSLDFVSEPQDAVGKDRGWSMDVKGERETGRTHTSEMQVLVPLAPVA